MNPGLNCSLDQIYFTTRDASRTLMSMVMDQTVNNAANATIPINCQVQYALRLVSTSLHSSSRGFRLLPQVVATFSFVSKSSY